MKPPKPTTPNTAATARHPRSAHGDPLGLGPRREALRALLELAGGRHTLDAVMERPQRSARGLPQRDRSLLWALVFGVLRWRGRLDWHLTRLSKKPLDALTPAIRELLRLGAFQILFLDRVPAAAAVHTAVALARESSAPWAAGYVNATLRRLIREADQVALPEEATDPVAALAVWHSLPTWLAMRWIERFGSAEAQQLGAASCAIPPITLRTNALRTSPAELATLLTPEVQRLSPCPHAPGGLQIVGPCKPLGDLAAYREGLFQVQDEAAQLVTPLLAPKPGERVLDACAGLGGKTGHLAQLMENRGELLAIDRSAAKLKRLDAEMRRLGASCVRCASADLLDPDLPSWGSFDRVLLDAPCSGLGVLRRNPDIKWRHGPQELPEFAVRQLALLKAAAQYVRPGSGRLLYCVCSFEPEETKQVVQQFLDSQANFTLEPISNQEVDSDMRSPTGCFCSLPHRHAMDGFFAARFLRTR